MLKLWQKSRYDKLALFAWCVLIFLIAYDCCVKISFLELEARHLESRNYFYLSEMRNLCLLIKKDQLRFHWIKSQNPHYEDLLCMKYFGVYGEDEK